MTVTINNTAYQIQKTDIVTLSGEEFITQQTEADKLKETIEEQYVTIKEHKNTIDALNSLLSIEIHKHNKTANYVTLLINKLKQPTVLDCNESLIQELYSLRQLVHSKNSLIDNLETRIQQTKKVINNQQSKHIETYA